MGIFLDLSHPTFQSIETLCPTSMRSVLVNGVYQKGCGDTLVE